MALNDRPIVRLVNAFFRGLAEAPLLGGVVRRKFIVIRYVGRRSGKTFETPVAYSRRGDAVTIGVSWPDSKSWWRNFLGEGGPITLVGLDGADRHGHAVANRDSSGAVAVRVQLAG
jgi:hypothetical protein